MWIIKACSKNLHNIFFVENSKTQSFFPTSVGLKWPFTWIPFTQGCFISWLAEIGFVFLEKKISKFHLCIFAILFYLSLAQNKTWIPFTQGCFMLSLIEIGTVSLEKRNFKFCQCLFRYFVIISPWGRAWAFIWTKLHPLYQRILCAMFVWNRPSGSGEDFLNFVTNIAKNK